MIQVTLILEPTTGVTAEHLQALLMANACSIPGLGGDVWERSVALDKQKLLAQVSSVEVAEIDLSCTRPLIR